MKINGNRLLSLVLALVMLVGILPLIAREAAATTEATDPMTDVLVEYSFDDEEAPTWTNSSVINASFDSENTYDGTGKSWTYTYKSAAKPQPYVYYNHTIVAGNTYRLTVYFKTSDSMNQTYTYLQAFPSSGSALQTASKTSTVNTTEWIFVDISFVATETTAASATRLRYLLGANLLAEGEQVWYDELLITETWTVENALTYGKTTITLTEDTDLTSFTQTEGGEAGVITIAAGQTLDLNGYTLKATSVTVEKGGQLIDSTDGKGRVEAAVTGNGGNTYLPVEVNEGEYIMVDPQITDKYITWVNNTDDTENPGFKIALRPGFGKYYDGDVEKSVRYDILASGGGGVSLKFSVAWADVYGQTGEADVYAAGADEFQKVYSSTTGKYFYASFTNPGDSQYYNVTVSLIANGFVISNTVAFENKPEANKTYLFAHNFDGTVTPNSDSTPKVYSMRGDDTYISMNATTGDYKIPTFSGDVMKFDGGTLSNNVNIYGIPEHTDTSTEIVVYEFDMMRVADDGYVKSAQTLLDIRSSSRYNLIGSLSSDGNSGNFRIQKYIGATGSDVSASATMNAPEGEWVTVKIVLDYAENTISFTMGDKTVTKSDLPTFSFSNTHYTMLTRTKEYDHYYFDNMKIYVINN